MADELDKLLKTKKGNQDKVYLCMWMEGENIKITPKRDEGKFQFNITPREGEIYHLLKALWDYEAG
jgi:hypothetical protein